MVFIFGDDEWVPAGTKKKQETAAAVNQIKFDFSGIGDVVSGVVDTFIEPFTPPPPPPPIMPQYDPQYDLDIAPYTPAPTMDQYWESAPVSAPDPFEGLFSGIGDTMANFNWDLDVSDQTNEAMSGWDGGFGIGGNADPFGINNPFQNVPPYQLYDHSLSWPDRYEHNPLAWENVEDNRPFTGFDAFAQPFTDFLSGFGGQSVDGRANTSAGIEYIGNPNWAAQDEAFFQSQGIPEYDFGLGGRASVDAGLTAPPSVFGLDLNAMDPAQARNILRVPFDEGFVDTTASTLGDAYSRINTGLDAFAETGLDFTPLLADIYAGEFVPNLLSNVPVVGDELAKASDISGYTSPFMGAFKVGGDIAERMGWYKPNTGYDDIGGTLENLGESRGNLWDFAQAQQEDLYERPLAEQLFGQLVYDPTNILGAGIIANTADAPKWLRTADKAIDVAQSAPFRVLKPVMPELLGAGAGLAANEWILSEDQQVPWWQAAAIGAGSGSLGIRGGNAINKLESKILPRLGYEESPELGAFFRRKKSNGITALGDMAAAAEEAASNGKLREFTDAADLLTQPEMREFTELAAADNGVTDFADAVRRMVDDGPDGQAFRQSLQSSMDFGEESLASKGRNVWQTNRGETIDLGTYTPRTDVGSSTVSSPGIDVTMSPTYKVREDQEFKAILEPLADEFKLRGLGGVAEEIRNGQAEMGKVIEERFITGKRMGLRGEELADYVGELPKGRFRKTFVDRSQVSNSDWQAGFEHLNRLMDEKKVTDFEYKRWTEALSEFRRSGYLEPADRENLWRVLGGDLSARLGYVSPTKINDPGPTLALPGFEGRFADGVESRPTLMEGTRFEGEGMAELVGTGDKALPDRARTIIEEWRGRREGDKFVGGAWEHLDAIDPSKETRLAAVRGALPTQLADQIVQEKNRLYNSLTVNTALAEDVADEYANRMVREYMDHRFGPLLSHDPKTGEDYIRTYTNLLAAMKPTATASDEAMLAARREELFQKDLAAGKYDYLKKHVQEMPDSFTKLTEEQKNAFYARHKELGEYESNLAKSAGRYVAETKNFMFGLFDFGVLGQQGLAAGHKGLVPFAVGAVNRMLNAAGMGTRLYDDAVELSLDEQRALAGLGVRARTGAVEAVEREGSILQHIPGLASLDQRLSVAAGKMTDVQFGKVLGGLRNVIYEGNLIMLKAGGEDVSNAAVRKVAAENANAITSAAMLARSNNRRALERAVLLSPSMTRSQGNLILQMSKLITPSASKADRIIAATTIASVVAATGVAYELSEATNGFGSGVKVNLDPTSPNFGKATIPNVFGNGNTVIQLFPQEQLPRAIMNATTELAKALDDDPDAILKAFATAAQDVGNYGVGRASPIVSTALKALGVGFDPEAGGWAWGDYGKDMNLGEKVLNALPLPPVVNSIVNKKTGNPTTFVVQEAGVSAYDESKSTALNRAMEEAYEDYESKWKFGSPDHDPLFRKKYKADHEEDVPPPSSDAAKVSAKLTEEKTAKMDAITDAFVKGIVKGVGDEWKKGTVGAWRSERGKIRDADRGARDLAKDLGLSFTKREKAPDGTGQQWVDSYFEAIEAGDEAVAEWIKDNGRQAQAYVQQYLTEGKNEVEAMYLKDMAQLDKLGYFDMPRYKMTKLDEDEAARIHAEADERRKLATIWFEEIKTAKKDDRPPVPPEFKDANEALYYAQKEATTVRLKYAADEYGYKMGSPESNDIYRYGKTKFYTDEYRELKAEHPELVIWFDNDATWRVIQELHR